MTMFIFWSTSTCGLLNLNTQSSQPTPQLPSCLCHEVLSRSIWLPVLGSSHPLCPSSHLVSILVALLGHCRQLCCHALAQLEYVSTRRVGRMQKKKCLTHERDPQDRSGDLRLPTHAQTPRITDAAAGPFGTRSVCVDGGCVALAKINFRTGSVGPRMPAAIHLRSSVIARESPISFGAHLEAVCRKCAVLRAFVCLGRFVSREVRVSETALPSIVGRETI
jgi:hypothetical protein